MPLRTAVPILAFLDMEKTVRFYQQLGFAVEAKWQDYLICIRDAVIIHLWRCDDENIPKNTGCYIHVTDIDALYKECQELQIVHPHGLLEDKPWNMRQFSILDNSGNIIHFGQSI